MSARARISGACDSIQCAPLKERASAATTGRDSFSAARQTLAGAGDKRQNRSLAPTGRNGNALFELLVAGNRWFDRLRVNKGQKPLDNGRRLV
jgi:hypothetical protein